MAALGLGGVMTGCSIPIPQATADPTRFYVLSTSAAPAAAPAANAPAVYLRTVELADYLRVRPIIVRRGQNEIEFREYARWGESLELGIGRVLREELLARGAAGSVLLTSVRVPGVEFDRELKVRVLAAEGTRDGEVNFRAIWEIATAGPGREIIARGDYRPGGLTWDGQSEATLVASLSAAVSELAAEISGALGK